MSVRIALLGGTLTAPSGGPGMGELRITATDAVMTNPAGRDTVVALDRCFAWTETVTGVYDTFVGPELTVALSAQQSFCVLCHGSQNSGKSRLLHTGFTTPLANGERTRDGDHASRLSTDAGVLRRALSAVFATASTAMVDSIRISILDVSFDSVRDLLNSRAILHLRETRQKRFALRGVKWRECKSEWDAGDAIKEALAYGYRDTAQQHTSVVVILDLLKKDTVDGRLKRRQRLTFVDLVPSDSIGTGTGAMSVDTTVLTLASCLENCAARWRRRLPADPSLPQFRNSSLTKVLKGTLTAPEGCRTLVLCTAAQGVSPATRSSNLELLRFAGRIRSMAVGRKVLERKSLVKKDESAVILAASPHQKNGVIGATDAWRALMALDAPHSITKKGGDNAVVPAAHRPLPPLSKEASPAAMVSPRVPLSSRSVHPKKESKGVALPVLLVPPRPSDGARSARVDGQQRRVKVAIPHPPLTGRPPHAIRPTLVVDITKPEPPRRGQSEDQKPAAGLLKVLQKQSDRRKSIVTDESSSRRQLVQAETAERAKVATKTQQAPQIVTAASVGAMRDGVVSSTDNGSLPPQPSSVIRSPSPSLPPRSPAPSSPPRSPAPLSPPRSPVPSSPPRSPAPSSPPRSPAPLSPPRSPASIPPTPPSRILSPVSDTATTNATRVDTQACLDTKASASVDESPPLPVPAEQSLLRVETPVAPLVEEPVDEEVIPPVAKHDDTPPAADFEEEYIDDWVTSS